MGCIYIATNKHNGKQYVGKTVKNIRTRKAWHMATAFRGEGWCLHRAIRKYGKDAFKWEITKESNDPSELDRLEQETIHALNTVRPAGYNLTRGGDGVVGRTPESLARIVAFHKGRKRSKETRNRISAACMGMKRRNGAVLSEETKRKISIAMIGKKMPVEHGQKISAYMSGRPKTEEQKRKMSEARKEWWSKHHQAVRNMKACKREEETGALFAGNAAEGVAQ